ncbi:MAG: hypothetical protein ACRDRA_17550, partial [Pseudonocardiaceae bacterium]
MHLAYTEITPGVSSTPVKDGGQALARFEEHRDPAVFEQLERPPYRGLQAIDYPEYWKLFTSAVSEMKVVRDQLI